MAAGETGTILLLALQIAVEQVKEPKTKSEAADITREAMNATPPTTNMQIQFVRRIIIIKIVVIGTRDVIEIEKSLTHTLNTLCPQDVPMDSHTLVMFAARPFKEILKQEVLNAIMPQLFLVEPLTQQTSAPTLMVSKKQPRKVIQITMAYAHQPKVR